MGAVPFAWRPADGTLAAVATIGIRHLPLAAPRKRYIRLARRRKGASAFFLAAQESAPDAVDGSSTGTEVPWMWVLLRPPRFGGAKYASGHDNRSRHRKVGFSNPRG